MSQQKRRLNSQFSGKSNLIISGLFWLSTLTGYTQSITLHGIIVDEQNHPLPYATIYERGTTNGTTTNADGHYQLLLTPGVKTIAVQYIGYQKLQREFTLSTSTEINFRLHPEALVLHEVVISAEDRDPAYRIIREAIRKRKLYENEVNAYSCDVYIKGVERLDKKPGSLLGMAITVDTGIVYFSESVSKLKFERPNKVNETIISSKVSGDNSSFSYNQASQMRFNLYQSQFFIEGLSERPFISPLANNSFLYYDFKLDGVIKEDTLLINKIKLIPKRPTDPVFRGYLYIIEGTWRIHSLNVYLTKDSGIEFIDSLSFMQVFAPTSLGIWMPLSQRFNFKFKIYGFQGSGYYTGIYTNYLIEPNYPVYRITVPQPKKDPPPKTEERKDLFTKKDFKKAVVKVEKEANQRDTAYWKDVRPVPLTPLEIQDYRVKAEIKKIKESESFKDSLDKTLNKFKFANLFVNGYTFSKSYKEHHYNFPTLFELLQYNTVEGFVPEFAVSLFGQKKRKTYLRITPKIKYGFSNRSFQGMVDWRYRASFTNPEYFYGQTGYYSTQLNGADPLYPFINTIYTLGLGENHQKLYQKTFFSFGYQRELWNGILLNSNISYSKRAPLVNTTDFSFHPRPSFTPNNPITLSGADSSFPVTRALLLDLLVRIRINQTYIDRPDERFYRPSAYPDLFIHYLKAFPIAGAEIDYDQLSVKLEKKGIKLGLIGESDISLETGIFLNTRNLTFIDYRHFNGNRTIIRQFNLEDRYQLLDYYLNSTTDRFLSGHYEHHFNEFIFNKIPLVKRLNLQSVFTTNYLLTPETQAIEFGFGIEHIFRFFRADYFIGIQDDQPKRWGIRLGIGF